MGNLRHTLLYCWIYDKRLVSFLGYSVNPISLKTSAEVFHTFNLGRALLARYPICGYISLIHKTEVIYLIPSQCPIRKPVDVPRTPMLYLVGRMAAYLYTIVIKLETYSLKLKVQLTLNQTIVYHALMTVQTDME